jgi:hypothetical protein
LCQFRIGYRLEIAPSCRTIAPEFDGRKESTPLESGYRLNTFGYRRAHPKSAKMLKNTFIHADGVGPATERKLWSAGVHTWDIFLAWQREKKFPFRNLQRLAPIVEESHWALRRRDVGFFTSRLKSSEQWRVYRDFSQQAAFVDIETTGLSSDFDQITVVGLFAGGSFHSFVHGKNLDQFPHVVAEYPLLVTFNGAQFDLPFLRKKFPDFHPVAHLDLRYPLSRLGYPRWWSTWSRFRAPHS